MTAGLLHFEKMTAQLNYVPPHKTLDLIEGTIEHLAENLRSASDHLARTSIPTARGDNVRVTSLAVVNDVVEHCHIVSMSTVLQTQFLDQQQRLISCKKELPLTNQHGTVVPTIVHFS